MTRDLSTVQTRVTGKVPKAAFTIPAPNHKNNAMRFNKTLFAFRELINFKLIGMDPIIPLLWSDVFAKLDSLHNVDPQMLIKLSGLWHNWFKLYVLQGTRARGDIPVAHWDAKNKCPRTFNKLVDYLDDCKDSEVRLELIRVSLSVFDIGKVLTYPVAPSLSSVTDKFSGTDQDGKGIAIDVALFNMDIHAGDTQASLESYSSSWDFHESTAAGPNGHALWSAHIDAMAVLDDDKLRETIRGICTKLQLNTLWDRMTTSASVFTTVISDTISWDAIKHSKLHLLFEKGSKSRLIAIGDYWTQACLTPFHNMLQDVMFNIKSDFTFNQETGAEVVKQLTLSHPGEVFSLDLSKATDRLPLAFQERVMAYLTGDAELAKLWAQLMSDRVFVTETGHKVKYAVGQPMGFKSSFDMLAISHHIIIQEAARRAGMVEYSAYAVLGDDCTLTGAKVADAYKAIMKELGVDISINKSIVPGIDNGLTGAEFCKRLFINGVEVTGIPTHLLANAIGNNSYHIALWEKMAERGILSGDNLWKFFSIFVSDQDLPTLFLLNGCPESVSGMRKPFPYKNAPMCDNRNWLSLYGFTADDLENFFAYALLQEQLSGLAGVIVKASTWLNIALENGRLGKLDYLDSGSEAPSLPLATILQEKIAKSKTDFDISHPIQDAARALGNKVVSLLNSLSAGDTSLSGVLLNRGIQKLAVSLDAKPTYVPKSVSDFGDRRILEKAIRLIQKSKVGGEWKPITFVTKLEGVSAMWSLTVQVGDKLYVKPHIHGMTKVKSLGGVDRLDRIARNTLLPGFLPTGKPK